MKNISLKILERDLRLITRVSYFGINVDEEKKKNIKKKLITASKILGGLAVTGATLHIYKKNKKANMPKNELIVDKNLPKNENVLFYLYGLGKCDSSDIDTDYNLKFNYKDKHALFFQNIEKYHKTYKHIYVKCDPKQTRIVKDIFKSCRNTLNVNNIFLQQMYNQINDLLNNENEVYIIGHSYGGSIASRLAMLLNNHKYANKLHIATTGSIYLIGKKEVNNIDFNQYMMPNDFALKCTNIKFDKNLNNFDETNNVTWIPVPTDVTYNLTELNSWTIHKSYESFTNKLIENKNFKI